MRIYTAYTRFSDRRNTAFSNQDIDISFLNMLGRVLEYCSVTFNVNRWTTSVGTFLLSDLASALPCCTLQDLWQRQIWSTELLTNGCGDSVSVRHISA